MLAVVEYLTAARGIGLRQLALQYLRRLFVERTALRYLAYVGLRELHRMSFTLTARLAVGRTCRLYRPILHIHVLPRQFVFGHHSLCLCRSTSRECHHSVSVYVSLAPGSHLAEAESAATEARVYHTSAQRNAKERVALGVFHHILALSRCHNLLHDLHAFVQSVARLLHVFLITTKGQQP